MFWNKKILPVICVFCISTSAEDTQPVESGAPAVPTVFSGKQSEQWMAVQSQLITARSKVENQEKIVESLILQKANLKGPELAEKIEALKEAHIELIRVIGYYNNLNSDFETRYPEKGAAPGRVYKRIDPASIQKIESKMTLEGRLNRLNAKIKKQYSQGADAIVKSDTDKNAKKNKKQSTPPAAASDEIKVTDQIILQK